MKTNGLYKYSITADNAVEIWEHTAPEGSAPFLRQPYLPGNPTPFATAEEAEAWAEKYLTNLQAPNPEPVEEIIEETV